MDDERRANPRFRCELLASVELEGATYAGTSADLSIGGVSLKIDTGMPVGSEILVLLTLGHGWTAQDFLRLPALVVRCSSDDDGFRIGAQFHPITDATAGRQLDLLIRILRGDLDRDLAAYRAAAKP